MPCLFHLQRGRGNGQRTSPIPKRAHGGIRGCYQRQLAKSTLWRFSLALVGSRTGTRFGGETNTGQDRFIDRLVNPEPNAFRSKRWPWTGTHQLPDRFLHPATDTAMSSFEGMGGKERRDAKVEDLTPGGLSEVGGGCCVFIENLIRQIAQRRLLVRFHNPVPESVSCQFPP
jgi:hypothetical protein